MPQTDTPEVRIERIRHELVRRELTVEKVAYLTPHMIRVTLGGEALTGFASAAPDDHIKLLFDGPNPEKPLMREYTPRRYCEKDNTLLVDFAIHDAGPATDWALNAKPGDSLRIGGPRGSQKIVGATKLLLIGDETALPAIGRWVEELPEGFPVTTLGAVPGAEDEQSFESPAKQENLWVHRPISEATDAAPLLAQLKTLAPPPDTFVWIAAEAQVARTLREWLLDTHGHPMAMLKARGYWTKGQADTPLSFT